MSDLSQRLANLSPAKRELLLLQLKKKKGGVHRRDFDKLNPADFFSIQHTGMTVEEMKTEAVLDPGIYPEAVIPPTPLFKGGKGGLQHVRNPSAIFLTGQQVLWVLFYSVNYSDLKGEACHSNFRAMDVNNTDDIRCID